MITLSNAQKIVAETLAEARRRSCAPMTVAVLDNAGVAKALAREDGASLLRPDIAFGKAWGALGMGFGSRTLARRVAEDAAMAPFFAALNAMSAGRVVPLPGGVLIRDAEGAVVGAVGVSGDTSDRDEACASVGVSAAGFTPDRGE